MSPHARLTVLALAAALALPGCRALGTGQGTGALVGALAGGGAGYAIGKHNGHHSKGTAAGALLGGAAGYLLGGAIDPDTHERPIQGPAVVRTSQDPAPPIGYGQRQRTVVRQPAPYRVVRGKASVTERVIVRDRTPGGRTIIIVE